MAILKFPPIESADENGLLAIGGDYELESLVLAYSQGIFPWPIDDIYPYAWFSPNPRGVLQLQDLKISKRNQRYFDKYNFDFRFNQNFEAVILNCAKVKRVNQNSTWINNEILEAYINLHRNNLAYSAETYLDNKLVGGMYGVYFNGVLSGESMFFSHDHASKFALSQACLHFQKKGFQLIDTQMTTEVIKAFGGKEIDRSEFINQQKLNPTLSFQDLFGSNL